MARKQASLAGPRDGKTSARRLTIRERLLDILPRIGVQMTAELVTHADIEGCVDSAHFVRGLLDVGHRPSSRTGPGGPFFELGAEGRDTAKMTKVLEDLFSELHQPAYGDSPGRVPCTTIPARIRKLRPRPQRSVPCPPIKGATSARGTRPRGQRHRLPAPPTTTQNTPRTHQSPRAAEPPPPYAAAPLPSVQPSAAPSSHFARVRAAFQDKVTEAAWIFRRVDREQTGLIGREDFRQTLAALQIHGTPKEVDTLYDSYNTTGIGIEYKKLEHFLTGAASARQPHSTEIDRSDAAEPLQLPRIPGAKLPGGGAKASRRSGAGTKEPPSHPKEANGNLRDEQLRLSDQQLRDVQLRLYKRQSAERRELLDGLARISEPLRSVDGTFGGAPVRPYMTVEQMRRQLRGMDVDSHRGNDVAHKVQARVI